VRRSLPAIEQFAPREALPQLVHIRFQFRTNQEAELKLACDFGLALLGQPLLWH
jgi:hypothetical protein